ncbi:MAG: hypothetical protein WCD77_12880, partial [Acidobacteriaceae bacterium]
MRLRTPLCKLQNKGVASRLMMKKLVYLLLVFVVGTVPALAVYAGTFTSVRVSKDVALETNPKSTFWQRSDPIFIVNDNWGKPVPG